MKKFYFILFISFIFSLTGCEHFNTEFCERPFLETPPALVTKIAFGSCSRENKVQPMLYTIANTNPDLFIYLGDNVYCDTENMDEMRNEYTKLSCKNEFQQLIASTYTLATWDDHDYGENNSGNWYPMKESSKEIFLEFWNEPDTSTRRDHLGIYHSVYFGDAQHRVQVILLDCRTFRTAQVEVNDDYIPDNSPDATMLGTAQWIWLEQELQKPAELRIICSSTQFGAEHNGMETWANYPLDHEKMFNLIQTTQANRVLFISGDTHYGDLSKVQKPGLYPVYDCTSSGLTEAEGPADNIYRIITGVDKINAGLITIDWAAQSLAIQLLGLNGNPFFTHTVPFTEIQF